jgi:hypothetical protein
MNNLLESPEQESYEDQVGKRFFLEKITKIIKCFILYEMLCSFRIFFKFFCGHRKGHSPLTTPIGSVYTLLFVVTSADTCLAHSYLC